MTSAEHEYSDIFSERLTEALEDIGWSRRKLAEQSGVTLAAIHSWFRTPPIRPTLENAAPCANALGVSLDWLTGLADQRTPIGDKMERGSVLIDEEVLEAVFARRPSAARLRKLLSWDPPLVNGMIILPERFRLVSYEEGRALVEKIQRRISGSQPRLYAEWYSRFENALDEEV
tara:strand:- start:6121 stop:6642 length:522 start_codon:yes stop_codon:yes gene_type:complete